MSEIKFKSDNILCRTCKSFEDTGLKDFIQYSSRGYVKSRIQVRFYCHKYMEYLTKFYSRCIGYG